MTTLTLDEALALAQQRHLAGDRPTAVAVCRQILAALPGQPGALLRLALIEFEEGNAEGGRSLAHQFLVACRDSVQACLTLAQAVERHDRPVAEAAWRRVLELEPGHAEAARALASPPPDPVAAALALVEAIHATPGNWAALQRLLDHVSGVPRLFGFLYEAVDRVCEGGAVEPFLFERLILFLAINGNQQGTERLVRRLAEACPSPRNRELVQLFNRAFTEVPAIAQTPHLGPFFLQVERDHWYRAFLRLLGACQDHGEGLPCAAFIPWSEAARRESGMASEPAVLYSRSGQELLADLVGHSTLGPQAGRALTGDGGGVLFTPLTGNDTLATPPIALALPSVAAGEELRVVCRFPGPEPRLGTLLLQLHGEAAGRQQVLPFQYVVPQVDGSAVELYAKTPAGVERVRLVMLVSGRRGRRLPSALAIEQGRRLGAYMMAHTMAPPKPLAMI